MKHLTEQVDQWGQPLSEETLKTFITDYGRELDLKMDGQPAEKLPRYGVWSDAGRGKLEVIETSNDLEFLLKKYNLTTSEVFKIQI